MRPGINRRQFIQGAAAAGLGYWVAGGLSARGAVSANEKLSVAIIGTHNRAADNIKEVARVNTANIVALCDVDENLLADTMGRFPKARGFPDFRKMLDVMHKSIDAVLVACPNHTHAVATCAALHLKKHVYCEKPLAHTVFEARTVENLAKKQGVVTQMGTQIHAQSNYRRAVEIVQAGLIGPVHEVHVWCDKTHSADPPMPTEAMPVPAGLNYDNWVGPAEFHEYNSAWLPAKWRRFWPYGDGTLGDMACHFQDLAFWALGLKSPTKIWAEGPTPDAQCCPKALVVHWEYAARGSQPPVTLSWYDGLGARIPKELMEKWHVDPNWKNGVLFIGDKGALFSDYDKHKLLPEKEFADAQMPPKSIPESIGHHREWIEACRANDPDAALCHFDYSGPLTEAVLLGNVAYRTGPEQKLEWDATNLRVTNIPEANRFLQYEYRKGWKL